ncbi:hypothetical protein C9374_003619 [Naegleria lovaniensis]|uniref:Uncharacterized protein n=1 Tax=Naegleria lovaniensis TaxID=51637 RepID=A0AA88H3A6_NAELO|nr:uncharacterized protein C9374_003619 [Naegleria lovaniensis]KAG2393855.1 hypothetical protein C9374_003619 [Naegleria lovaniensis]
MSNLKEHTDSKSERHNSRVLSSLQQPSSWKDVAPLHALLESQDALLTIFEFLERNYVVNRLAFCSKLFYTLAHKPYHYTRLVWNFSKDQQDRLDRTRKFYSQVKKLEVEDSLKFAETNIEKRRIQEFTKFISEQKESLTAMELVFHRNQTELFNNIVNICGNVLTHLSIKISLQADFAMMVCSNLMRFSKLQSLTLLIGNSIDSERVFVCCKPVFENVGIRQFQCSSTIRNSEQLQQFMSVLKPATDTLRELSFSLNCEFNSEQLLSDFANMLQPMNKITLTLMELANIDFLNSLNTLSAKCAEFNIRLLSVKKSTHIPIQLQNVNEFYVEDARYDPVINDFPTNMKRLTFIPGITVIKQRNHLNFAAMDMDFFNKFKTLTTIELNHVIIGSIGPNAANALPYLEIFKCTHCKTIDVRSHAIISERLRILYFASCVFTHRTNYLPYNNLTHLRNLTVIQVPGTQSALDLQALDGLILEHLDLTNLRCTNDFDFEKLSYIETMTSLKYLNLSNMDILTKIAPKLDISRLTNLTHLIMQSSSIDVPTKPFFPNLNLDFLFKQAVVSISTHHSTMFVNIGNNKEEVLQISEKSIPSLLYKHLLQNNTNKPELENIAIYKVFFNADLLYLSYVLNPVPPVSIASSRINSSDHESYTIYCVLTIEHKPPHKVLSNAEVYREKRQLIDSNSIFETNCLTRLSEYSHLKSSSCQIV